MVKTTDTLLALISLLFQTTHALNFPEPEAALQHFFQFVILTSFVEPFETGKEIDVELSICSVWIGHPGSKLSLQTGF